MFKRNRISFVHILAALGVFIITCLMSIKVADMMGLISNRIESQKVVTLQKELNQYKKQEQEEIKRQEEIKKRLNDPNIILGEFRKVGKLVIFKSDVTYQNTIQQDKWFGNRKVMLDLTYKMGISYDLHSIDIRVVDTKEKHGRMCVEVYMPKYRLRLEYLELLNESKVNGEKSLLVKAFTPEELDYISDLANSQTLNRINSTEEIYNQAYDNLKSELMKMIDNLSEQFNFTYDSIAFIDGETNQNIKQKGGK